MALSPRLDLRQSQSLVITPQLQQAIKLLQLSATELQAYVEQELQSNPLLEMFDLKKSLIPFQRTVSRISEMTSKNWGK